MTSGDAPPKGSTLTDEVTLTDELIEVARAHPGSQWLAFGRGLEERLGARTDRTSGGRHRAEVRRGRSP